MALLGQYAPTLQGVQEDVKEGPPDEKDPGAHGFVVPTA
jgi:hypothetical protein